VISSVTLAIVVVVFFIVIAGTPLTFLAFFCVNTLVLLERVLAREVLSTKLA
jgi:hypothetical protein